MDGNNMMGDIGYGGPAPVPTYGNMPPQPQPISNANMARRTLRQKYLPRGYARMNRASQRRATVNAHRRAFANMKRRPATLNIPVVNTTRSTRIRKAPIRYINNTSVKRTNKAAASRGTKKNVDKGKLVQQYLAQLKRGEKVRLAGKATKAQREALVDARGKFKKMENARTGRARPAPTTFRMNNTRSNENSPVERNPYAVRLGQIKQKYDAIIAAKEDEISLAIGAKNYRSAAIMKKEIAAIQQQKKAEQNAARQGIKAEGQQADELANMFGSKISMGGPGWGMPPAGPGYANNNSM